MSPRCIFHVPLQLNRDHPSASQIRPLRMLDAFRNLGYDVYVIEGNSRDRRNQIAKLSIDIKKGLQYDFLYSESSTMPTLLTDSDHLPRAPYLDFGFFNLCKCYSIPIGLFYRDMYWLYPEYLATSTLKRLVAKIFYRYDLLQYKRFVDVLFFPSMESSKVIAPYINGVMFDELPPGCDEIPQDYNILGLEKSDIALRPLRLFYVGGIGAHYGFHELLRTLSKDQRVEVRMCVRPDDWEKVTCDYVRYLASGNISIVHSSGEGLREHYAWADAGLLYFDKNDYQSMAIPYKTFEYLGNALPIIATDDTAAGRFVRQNEIGFSVSRGGRKLTELAGHLYADRSPLLRIKQQCLKTLHEHTWKKRAQRVVEALNCKRVES